MRFVLSRCSRSVRVCSRVFGRARACQQTSASTDKTRARVRTLTRSFARITLFIRCVCSVRDSLCLACSKRFMYYPSINLIRGFCRAYELFFSSAFFCLLRLVFGLIHSQLNPMHYYTIYSCLLLFLFIQEYGTLTLRGATENGNTLTDAIVCKRHW